MKSRKGVNLPSLNSRLPSLTGKDRRDLEFGISEEIDFVSLSFVRRAADIRELKALPAAWNAVELPVLAKIESHRQWPTSR